jgi:hypothetical protein
MAALWRAIRTNAPATGLPAFFPEAAYAQVKAIADPRAARLLALHIPVAYVHWVDPGVCYNRIGYYEVPNSRIVYRTAAGLHSFGIASMISWRGTWYVVHLGAVVRSQPGGIVDAPSAGAGASAPSSTC